MWIKISEKRRRSDESLGGERRKENEDCISLLFVMYWTKYATKDPDPAQHHPIQDVSF